MIKQLLITSTLLTTIFSCSHEYQNIFIKKTIYTKEIKEKLGYSFGTILDIQAKIIDGDNYQLASWKGRLLLQIQVVNKIKLDTPQILFFENQDLTFNNFKSIINKTISLKAFETGGFVGRPPGTDNHLMNSSYLYHFQNRMVVLNVNINSN